MKLTPWLPTLCGLASLLAAIGARAQVVSPYTRTVNAIVGGHVVFVRPENGSAPRYFPPSVLAGMRLFYKHGVRPAEIAAIRHYGATFEFEVPPLQQGEKLLGSQLEIRESGRGGHCAGPASFTFELRAYEGNGQRDTDDVEDGEVIKTAAIGPTDPQVFPEPIDVTALVRDAMENRENALLPAPLSHIGHSGFLGFNVLQTTEATCVRYFGVRLVLQIQPAPASGTGIRG